MCAGRTREGEAGATTRTGQRHIRSITVGFDIMRCLEVANHPLSLKEIAECSGLPSSRVHLYLTSFKMVGLVVQDADTTRYSLGPYALQLGLAAMRQIDVIGLSRRYMSELQQSTGETVYLSVWGNRGPSIVAKLDGPHALPMEVRVGFVLPVLRSATGRVFLAYMPRHETAGIVEEEFTGAAGRSSPVKTRRELEAIAERIRADGLARTESLLYGGNSAFAAPLLDHDGKLRAVLSVIAPSDLTDERRKQEIARQLRALAQRISHILGFDPEDRPDG